MKKPYLDIAVFSGQMEGRESFLGSRWDAGAVLQQDARHLVLALLGGNVEGGVQVLGHAINLDR